VRITLSFQIEPSHAPLKSISLALTGLLLQTNRNSKFESCLSKIFLRHNFDSFFKKFLNLSNRMNIEKNKQVQQWETVLQTNATEAKMYLDLIKYPVITEKSYIGLFKNRQYTFDVHMSLTKTQIRKLFEGLFNVNIIGINTQIPPRKRIRVGTKMGYRPQYKRVIVTLQEGQSIRLSSN